MTAVSHSHSWCSCRQCIVAWECSQGKELSWWLHTCPFPPSNNSALPLQQAQYSGFLLSTQSVAQSLQAISMKLTLDFSLNLTSEAWASVSRPILHQQRSISVSRAQGVGAEFLCRILSILPSTKCCHSILPGSEAPPPIYLIFPSVKRLPWVWEPFLFHSFLLWAQLWLLWFSC